MGLSGDIADPNAEMGKPKVGIGGGNSEFCFGLIRFEKLTIASSLAGHSPRELACGIYGL